MHMEKKKTNLPPSKPYHNDGYDDDNIPEIDLPKTTDATNVIPDEVPRRDGPGGEQEGNSLLLC